MLTWFGVDCGCCTPKVTETLAPSLTDLVKRVVAGESKSSNHSAFQIMSMLYPFFNYPANGRWLIDNNDNDSYIWIATCIARPMRAAHVASTKFLNVSGFESWLLTVGDADAAGAAGDVTAGSSDANFERASAWVNLFRYHRQTQVVANLSAAVALMSAEADDSRRGDKGGRDPSNATEAAPSSNPNNTRHSSTSKIQSNQHERGGCVPDLKNAKCFVDHNTCGSRVVQNCAILPRTEWISEPQTQESCAVACAQDNYTYVLAPRYSRVQLRVLQSTTRACWYDSFRSQVNLSG